MRVTMSEEQARRVYPLVCWLVLSLVMGLRGFTVGTDTPQYVEDFAVTRGSDLFGGLSTTRYEPLFYAFMWLVGRVTDEPGVFLLLESAITCALMIRFFCLCEGDLIVTIAIWQLAYHYCSAFNISRAWLAISVALQGYDMARRGELLESVAICLVAACVHTSAVFMLPCLIISRHEDGVDDAAVVLLTLIAPALCLALVEAAPLLYGTIGKYELYLRYDDASASAGLFAPFLILASLASSALLSLEGKRGQRAYEVLVVFGAALILLTGALPLASRVSQMFSVFLAPLVAGTALQSRWGKAYAYSVVAVLYVYYAVQLLSNNAGVVPYSTWLFG